MNRKESTLLKEQNKLVKELAIGIKQVIKGKVKPFK